MLGHHARIPSVLIAGVVALTAPAVPARAAAPGDLRTDLDAILADRLAFTGAAAAQVDEVVRRVDAVSSRYPEAAKYRPGAIL